MGLRHAPEARIAVLTKAARLVGALRRAALRAPLVIFGPPSQFGVMLRVFGWRQDLKVLGAVVRLDVVDVMNNFISRQRPSEHTLDHNPVLRTVRSVIGLDVPVEAIEDAPAAPSSVQRSRTADLGARTGAEPTVAPLNPFFRGRERRVTPLAASFLTPPFRVGHSLGAPRVVARTGAELPTPPPRILGCHEERRSASETDARDGTLVGHQAHSWCQTRAARTVPGHFASRNCSTRQGVSLGYYAIGDCN